MPIIPIEVHSDGKCSMSWWTRLLIRVGYYREIEIDVGETVAYLRVSDTQVFPVSFKGSILAHLFNQPFELTASQKAEMWLNRSVQEGFFKIDDKTYINHRYVKEVTMEHRPFMVKTYSS